MVIASLVITNPNAQIKLVFNYDGGGNGKGGIDKTQPAVFSADETTDIGLDDATQVADKVFKRF